MIETSHHRFRVMIRHAPTLPPADLRRALDLMQQGQFSAAATVFQTLSDAHPDLAVAHAGLGRCLGRLGHRLRALDALRQAARLMGRALRRGMPGDAVLDLVFEMQTLHAHAESLPVIDTVLRSHPGLARAHHLKALALEREKRIDEALRSAARAVALAPHEDNAHLLLATLEARCGTPEQARARLEARMPLAPPVLQARMGQELGRILALQGEHASAFAATTRANALQLSALVQAGFDPERLYTELSEERRRCTPEWIAHHALPATAAAPCDPIFLIGFYRSGTTLLEQMFASHPALRVSGEADLIPQVLHQLRATSAGRHAHWTQAWESIDAAARQRLRARYFEHAAASIGPIPPRLRLLDKTTLNTVHIGLIRTLFPRAHVIFALRDPRDVLLSCFTQSFVPTPLTAQLLDWTQGARFYDQVMLHWHAMRPALGESATVVRYEDVVADPHSALAPVLASAGLSWATDMTRFHEQAHRRPISTPSFAAVTRPIYADAVGRWRRHAGQFDAVMPWIARHLQDGGYA